MASTSGPDPRLVEDLIAAGDIAWRRSRRNADERELAAIRRAVDWLLERARELRQERA